MPKIKDRHCTGTPADRGWRRYRAAGAAATIALALLAPAPAAAATDQSRPKLADGVTAPTYSYQNAIRESVRVQTPVDTDGDGQPDQVAVDIIRPREAEATGVKVPVILEASPYYASSSGRGMEKERKKYDAAGVISSMPLYYDNYFVPRGYAFVAVDMLGTGRSSGCTSMGGRDEVLATKAVIDWLNGRAPGFRLDGTPVTASWTNGATGMIGKSYDGTLANAVAATGVKGLKTIVPISAISSWYDYTRYTGALPDWGAAEFYLSFVSTRPEGVCDAYWKDLIAASDDQTASYNDFWRERDYLTGVDSVKASVFVAHGIDDLNVHPSQGTAWYSALAKRGVPHKIWLSRAGHADPFDVRRAEWVRTLHRWFDFWLMGVRNGIDKEPKATIETKPGVWDEEADWPPAGTSPVPAALGATGQLGGAPAASGTIRTLTDDPDQTEPVAVADPTAARSSRLAFLTSSLLTDTRIAGAPSVTLRVQVDKPTTLLTAKLVDYGPADRVDSADNGYTGVRNVDTQSCWGESIPDDDACYLDAKMTIKATDFGILSRGWLGADHHASLSRPEPLLPGVWYTMTIPMETTETVVPTGHRLGLVITQSDVTWAKSYLPEKPLPTSTGATVLVDLSASSLTLPLAGVGTSTSSALGRLGR